MEITHDIIDIEKYEAQGYLPAALIPRGKAEKWLVRAVPVGVAPTTPTKDWSLTAEGEHIRIPAFPYFSHSNDPAVALAFSAELAVQALMQVQGNFDVRRIHMVYGSPVQEVDNPALAAAVLRFWVGFGYLIKEKQHG
jgi:hypothetical protein